MRSIIPAQVRGARGLLGWNLLDLAKAAGLSVSTVKRFEDGTHPDASSRTVEAMLRAFGDHGVVFEDGEGGELRFALRSVCPSPPICVLALHVSRAAPAGSVSRMG